MTSPSNPGRAAHLVGPSDTETLHVLGRARHAFRNVSDRPAVSIIATTCRMARFFRELAAATAERTGAPSEAALRRFAEIAARYGYWNATPEENARVGLTMPGQPSRGA